MNIEKESWTKESIKEFQKYLESFSNKSKIEWTKRIVCTNKNVLAISSPILKNIAKMIKKSNFLMFLNQKIDNYYENDLINGMLINQIKDFEIAKKYLIEYAKQIDCWATSDTISLKITNENKEKYFDLAKEFLLSSQIFSRRIGLKILFKYVEDNNYISKIFNMLDSLKNEKEYYVNMIGAWLLAECFIKQREKTLQYFKNNNTNSFIINKSISKCNDSFRVSKTDKILLKNFRIH